MKKLLLLATLIPALTYANSESAGIVDKPFEIGNCTRALLYYQCVSKLDGQFNSCTFKNSSCSSSGAIPSGQRHRIPPIMAIDSSNLWGNEIDLKLSINPQQQWLAWKINPGTYHVHQMNNGALLLEKVS